MYVKYFIMKQGTKIALILLASATIIGGGIWWYNSSRKKSGNKTKDGRKIDIVNTSVK